MQKLIYDDIEVELKKRRNLQAKHVEVALTRLQPIQGFQVMSNLHTM